MQKKIVNNKIFLYVKRNYAKVTVKFKKSYQIIHKQLSKSGYFNRFDEILELMSSLKKIVKKSMLR